MGRWTDTAAIKPAADVPPGLPDTWYARTCTSNVMFPALEGPQQAEVALQLAKCVATGNCQAFDLRAEFCAELTSGEMFGKRLPLEAIFTQQGGKVCRGGHFQL